MAKPKKVVETPVVVEEVAVPISLVPPVNDEGFNV